jgi:hypothetical protein
MAVDLSIVCGDQAKYFSRLSRGVEAGLDNPKITMLNLDLGDATPQKPGATATTCHQ